jgi:hypothetical protein
LPDVAPPSQIDDGPMGTTTHIPFLKRMLGPTQTVEPVGPAMPSNADAIDGLAHLGSARAPRGVVLVAEVGAEQWAPIRLDDHHVVVGPFQPGGELVALLVERAHQLRRVQRSRNHLLRRGWPGTGYDRPAIG